MGVRQWLLLGLVLGLFSAQTQAEVYRWKDASGRTIYGDNPPESAKSAPVDLPPLTISDGFKSPSADKPKADSTEAKKPETEQKKPEFKYESFTVTAPKADEGIRANDGTLTISLDLQPSLQTGHKLIVYVDSKQVGSGTDLSYTLSNVDRGTHTTFAVIQDEQDNIILNTEVTTFHVFRAKKPNTILNSNESVNPSRVI